MFISVASVTSLSCFDVCLSHGWIKLWWSTCIVQSLNLYLEKNKQDRDVENTYIWLENRLYEYFNKAVPCPMGIKIPTIPSGRCFTCVVFYTYYPVTSVRTYFQTVSSYAQTGQCNLLPIVRIFHLSRWIQFTEQLIIPQYLLADSGLVGRWRRRTAIKKFSCWKYNKNIALMCPLPYYLTYLLKHLRCKYPEFHLEYYLQRKKKSMYFNLVFKVITQRFQIIY